MSDTVRKLGDDIKEAGRGAWLASLGLLALADEQARVWFQHLREKGEQFESSERNVAGRAFDRAAGSARTYGRKVEDAVRGTVDSTLHRAGVPTHDDIRTLEDRVQELTRKIEALRTRTA